jgi:lipopolysaccharide transport system ATP-binding protein
MTKPVIEVKNLSKSYVINHQKVMQKHSMLKNVVDTIQKPLGGGGPGYSHETFWALKDVSFDVQQGEIFGILGKNGSGKSTLLKILSRIVDPTEGEIKIHGRVTSLLEVGTGFHPELTGRENVFLNGSMLGLSRREIIGRFDEIVEFSEIEKFIDTPVKFYSSGMYVRLAFSVAAHLESDILILDEVLSVGDAAFQKKSLDKVMSTIREGRTVLFVSHSMSSVKQICNKALLLENGKIKYIGESEFVTDQYLADNTPLEPETLIEENPKKKAQILDVRLCTPSGEKVEIVDQYKSWEIKLKYKAYEPCENTIVAAEIITQEGQTIFMTANTDKNKKMSTLEKGTYEATISFADFHFTPGTYSIRISIQSPGKTLHDSHEGSVLRIRTDRNDIRSQYFDGKYFGHITDKITWDISEKS